MNPGSSLNIHRSLPLLAKTWRKRSEQINGKLSFGSFSGWEKKPELTVSRLLCPLLDNPGVQGMKARRSQVLGGLMISFSSVTDSEIFGHLFTVFSCPSTCFSLPSVRYTLSPAFQYLRSNYQWILPISKKPHTMYRCVLWETHTICRCVLWESTCNV